MLESMGKLIGYEGEFAILSSTPTATNQNAWIDFMKKKLASEPKFAKMKLVQIAYGEESEQVNQQQALALVAGLPEPQGDHRPGRHRPAGGGARARAGRADRQDQADRPGAGDPHEEVHQGRPGPGHLVERQGPRLPHLLRRAGLAQCKVTGKEGETFKAGRLGEYTVGANGEVVLGPAQIVTPEERRQVQVLSASAPRPGRGAPPS